MSNKGFNVKKIIAHNFQSHKHSEIEFSDGLTVICGESDRGKTSLCKRLFSWVINNDLSGDFFVRNNDSGKTNSKGELLKEEECYGTVIFENGITLTRKKIKTKNIYELIDENGEVFEFENFGHEVPLKIRETIPLGNIKIDKDLIINPNFPPKKEEGIIYKPNGAKTKILGSFCNTHIIDSALREKKSEMLSNSNEKNILEKEVKELEQKLIVFGDMERKEKLIENGDVLYKNIQTNTSLLKKVNDIVTIKKQKEDAILELNKTLNTKRYIEEEEKHTKELEKRISEISKNNEIFNKLKDLYLKIKENKENLDLNNKIIETKNNILEKDIKLRELEIKIEKINSSSYNQINDMKRLNNIKEKKEKLNKSLLENNRTISIKKYINDLNEKIIIFEEKVDNFKENVISLNNISDKYKNINEKEKMISKLNLIINEKSKLIKFEKYIFDKEKNIIDIKEKIEKKNNILNNISKLNKELNQKILKEKDGSPKLEQMKKNFESMINSYIEEVKTLGKCPICCSNLTLEHLSSIKEELIK